MAERDFLSRVVETIANGASDAAHSILTGRDRRLSNPTIQNGSFTDHGDGELSLRNAARAENVVPDDILRITQKNGTVITATYRSSSFVEGRIVYSLMVANGEEVEIFKLRSRDIESWEKVKEL